MTIEDRYFEIGHLDRLSYGDTLIHSLDPRAKLLVTFFFMIVVVSFSKYQVSGLVPLLVFPVVMSSLADIPATLLLKKILAVSPFAILLGIVNPFLDHHIVAHVGGLPVSAGWISFGSIIMRFVLTVSAALILVATTSFPGICYAMERLKAPRILVLQLLFLYRFSFVLVEEAVRMARARDMRSFAGRGTGMKVYGQLVGMLFLRAADRAQRIHEAMFSRGFSGFFYVPRNSRMNYRDGLFMAGWTGFFVLCRWYNLSEILGTAFLKASGTG